MLTAYIDESYVDGRVYLVGAAVFTAEQHRRLGLAFEEILWKTNKAHGTPLGLEFHGQNLFQQTETWKSLRGKPNLAFAIYRRAAFQIVGSGCRIIVRGIDGTDRLGTRYTHPDHPHTTALGHLLERLEDHAVRTGQRIAIVADRVPDQAQHERRMAEYQLVGTPGYRPAKLEHIDMPFTWADSAEHAGLQAIDLALYIYRRKRYMRDADPRKAYEVQRIRDQIYPAFQYHNVWTVPRS